VLDIYETSLLMALVIISSEDNWRPEDSTEILMLVKINGESEDHGRRRTKFLK
jgi:hypothetical protein